MKKGVNLAILIVLLSIYQGTGQETPTPAPSPALTPEISATTSPTPAPSVTPVPSLTPEESSSPSSTLSPAPSLTPEESPSPSPTASPARAVSISFLPPPLEGKISLGIYDSAGALVRVLHDEADLDAFTTGADALITKWDGKDDQGRDLPPGRYHARGYLVGPIMVQDLGADAGQAGVPATIDAVRIKLMANPLTKGERQTLAVKVAVENADTVLKTTDDLPLFTISSRANAIRLSIAKSGDKAIDLWQDNGNAVNHFRVSNLDKMMAFDCGEIELK